MQTAYGYYLATLQWDQLAALFADDGSIEIALRGVYVGRPAVRRNLDLYGQAGLDDGVLHNHMQFQMVIDVGADGKSARLRSRALSMMGNFNRNATWMGGNYENEFVKVNGRWMFHRDHQVNTYFAPYETGWKDLAQRAPPGITDANPPDLPPSLKFDLYPKNFLLALPLSEPGDGEALHAELTGCGALLQRQRSFNNDALLALRFRQLLRAHHQPCTCGRCGTGTLIFATGGAAMLSASRIHSSLS